MWVGNLPGTRESRRLLGDHILTEQEIPEQDLKSVVAGAGYEAVSISREPYGKKRLFSAFRR